VERAIGREIPVRYVPPGEPVPFVPEAVQGPAAMLDSFDSPLPMAGTAATYGVTLTPLANVLQRMFGAHESNSLSASERG
jgi:NADH dehydrogenase